MPHHAQGYIEESNLPRALRDGIVRFSFPPPPRGGAKKQFVFLRTHTGSRMGLDL